MMSYEWPDLTFGPINLWSFPKMNYEDYLKFKEEFENDVPANWVLGASFKKKVTDKNVEELISMLANRMKTGYTKYGTTTERTDLSPTDWIQHAIEEALDFAVYLQKLKGYFNDSNP